MTKEYRYWLVLEKTDAAITPDENATRTLLSQFEHKEEAMVFETELLRRYCAQATGETDLARARRAIETITLLAEDLPLEDV